MEFLPIPATPLDWEVLAVFLAGASFGAGIMELGKNKINWFSLLPLIFIILAILCLFPISP